MFGCSCGHGFLVCRCGKCIVLEECEMRIVAVAYVVHLLLALQFVIFQSLLCTARVDFCDEA
jgi:hypothetical protein